jgi:hypothetical protein
MCCEAPQVPDGEIHTPIARNSGNDRFGAYFYGLNLSMRIAIADGKPEYHMAVMARCTHCAGHGIYELENSAWLSLATGNKKRQTWQPLWFNYY